ncbi:MAG: hypothetical protein H6867_10245 [Rhodospirillales bacterium]|nr:hypothetical protein [Rhodospirillales bacterium]MCB9995836.1 hypothetical protein [Rhodospirillales bacterium]
MPNNTPDSDQPSVVDIDEMLTLFEGLTLKKAEFSRHGEVPECLQQAFDTVKGCIVKQHMTTDELFKITLNSCPPCPK